MLIHINKEKAALGAGTSESGKENIYELSITQTGEKVNPTILCGYFTMDEDGNALLHGAPVGAMIGEMLRRSGYAYIKINVWREENA